MGDDRDMLGGQEGEWTMEADGRCWDRPTRAIIACGTDDAVIVEPVLLVSILPAWCCSAPSL